MFYKLTFFLFVCVFIFGHTKIFYAQGCSDAGFCTIGNLKPSEIDSNAALKNVCKLGFSAGKADNGISVFSSIFEWNRQLSTKVSINTKLSVLRQSGKELSSFGFSDFYIYSGYAITKQLNVTGGIKIPLSNANRQKNELSLPMDYQSSLGTYDVIGGISYTIKKLSIAAAVQQPLTQNDNAFRSDNMSSTSPFANFQTTNQFKRSADVLLRISYPFQIGKYLKITSSLLPIYHIKNDRYTDNMQVEREIIGSKGLTLNGNVFFDIQLHSKHAIQLSLARPFIVRDARPDGLTRSFIAAVEYHVRF